MPSRALPARPSLEQYKKQAKELVTAYRAGDAEATQRVRAHHPRFAKADDSGFKLADAQLVIAREHGFASWPKFVKQIEASSGRLAPATVWRTAEEAVVAGDVATLEALLRDYGDILRHEQPQSWWNNTLTPDYQAVDARAIIASTHEFGGWDELIAHAEMVRDGSSPVARFEAAVDAVVRGDVAKLTGLLAESPELVRARSPRRHHSTLLHYVGANGVEGFRQHTPRNAVDIAELLLDAGADVNAVADMYGGSTTLGLVATSLHPWLAGVQQPLIELLLDRGASLEPSAAAGGRSLVHACLANGRPEAAEYLASRGAPLAFEDAAGVGRLDVVRSHLSDGDGTPTKEQMERALISSATYGRTAVAEFLLDRGVDVDARADGFTGVNAAATSGHFETVRLFLARGASLELRNRYGGTALEAALWGAANRPREADYVPVIETLLAAGARVNPDAVQWWRQQQAASPEAHARILELLANRGDAG
jgi:ankyrin repeat protein